MLFKRVPQYCTGSPPSATVDFPTPFPIFVSLLHFIFYRKSLGQPPLSKLAENGKEVHRSGMTEASEASEASEPSEEPYTGERSALPTPESDWTGVIGRRAELHMRIHASLRIPRASLKLMAFIRNGLCRAFPPRRCRQRKLTLH